MSLSSILSQDVLPMNTGMALLLHHQEEGLNTCPQLHPFLPELVSIHSLEVTGRLSIQKIQSPVGSALLCCNDMGHVHRLEFEHDALNLLSWTNQLRAQYPNAQWGPPSSAAQTTGANLFLNTMKPRSKPQPLTIYVQQASTFELSTWQALLHLPAGRIINYRNLAASIGQPNAARAVGNALAKNTVGYLIPCHRVLTVRGEVGQFRWGAPLKQALLNWEHATINQL